MYTQGQPSRTPPSGAANQTSATAKAIPTRSQRPVASHRSTGQASTIAIAARAPQSVSLGRAG